MLEDILNVLVEAVTRGGVEVLKAKRSGAVVAEYKDATELVTQADKLSDAAILSVFQARLPAIDPTISFRLEESGDSGSPSRRIAGADPIDGTNHFACGGNLYSVQAHYVEDGVPMVGVVFQPEAYLPSEEDAACVGRLAWAILGRGAFLRRSVFSGQAFDLCDARPLRKRECPRTRTYTACVPLSTKMAPGDRARAMRVHDSGIVASTTGTGGAGGNVMMAILGGQHVYANFGAGDDLDLIPPQVIAEEAGMTVWGSDRRSPVWNVRKQPFIVAPSPEIAEEFFRAAGL
jgi:fructose-1,6-bisphosphatase/inositol monophosphatase family enzyme